MLQQGKNQSARQFLSQVGGLISQCENLQKMGIPSSVPGRRIHLLEQGLIGGVRQRLRDRRLQKQGVQVFYMASGFRTEIKYL